MYIWLTLVKSALKKSFAQKNRFFWDFLWCSYSPYLKKKIFHLQEGTMNTFWESKKVKKLQDTAQYFEKGFTGLSFS